MQSPIFFSFSTRDRRSSTSSDHDLGHLAAARLRSIDRQTDRQTMTSVTWQQRGSSQLTDRQTDRQTDHDLSHSAAARQRSIDRHEADWGSTVQLRQTDTVI
jgi:hypothetical protein